MHFVQKQLAVVVLALFSVAGALSANADQFAYNSRTVCSNALRFFKPGSVVISYCSECDNEHVEIWRVKEAFVADVQFQNQFAVVVFAKKLYRSAAAFDSGKYRARAAYEKIPDGESSLSFEEVDLAYVYVRGQDRKFVSAAAQLGLSPLHVKVKEVHLPKKVAASVFQ